MIQPLSLSTVKQSKRIFLIGHNKCGTRSFHNLLRKNGYKSIHFGNGNLARKVQANFIFSRPLLMGIDRFNCYTDMEICGEFYAYRLFPLFDLQYPGSCFVLNTRDVDRWIESRFNHGDGRYAKKYLKRMRESFENPSLTLDSLRDHWKKAWKRHETDVRRYFAGRKNFFEFDITNSDQQAQLCQFLRDTGFQIEDDCLPHRGVTKTQQTR